MSSPFDPLSNHRTWSFILPAGTNTIRPYVPDWEYQQVERLNKPDAWYAQLEALEKDGWEGCPGLFVGTEGKEYIPFRRDRRTVKTAP